MEQNLFNQNQSKEVSIFNFENQNVRTVTIENEVWFVASDVTKILGYQNGRDAISKHCLDGVAKKYTIKDVVNRTQEVTIINESGIYQLVMASKMPNAIKFKQWVTEKILPSIRKTGSYSISQNQFKIPKTFSEALRLAADQSDLIEEQNKKIQEDKPKVEFYDIVSDTKKGIHITVFAKSIDWKPKSLFDWLKDNDYIYRRNGENIPYQKYIEAGYFKLSETVDRFTKKVYSTPLITGKGQIYFTNKLK
jgi:anti-repressor protein